jgi:Mrp family chromosome partitioning ATPase
MNETTTDTASIFAPLWKRKWLILLVGLVVAGATYEYYKHKTPLYTAKTSLYLGGSSEQGASGASGAAKTPSASGRELTNQVELINSPIIGTPVRKHLREEGDLVGARTKLKAAASPTSSFITITTEGPSPRIDVKLANAYAQAYIARQRSNYFKGLRAAIANSREQLRRIETPQPGKGKGSKGSTSATSAIQAATLASKINQLESGLTGYAGVQQVGTAKANPLPLSPSPKKNAIFGFVLGLLLAAVAAYAFSQFDRRLSSLPDIESVFGTQILTALPKVRSPVLRPGGERAPAKPLLEPLRRLHTSLQLGNAIGREGGPRTIVFVSADSGDGRSSLVTNLARVQRDAGARVVVVEADMRRPALGRMLDVAGPGGLAEVLSGALTLDEAMRTVEAPRAGTSASGQAAVGAVSTVVAPRGTGSLSVLLSGEAVDNPPALLARPAMGELVRSLGEEYDYVLIDTPSPLEVSDVMPLLALVDGIIIVARVGHTRDHSARLLAQLLGRTASAPVIGVVANCVASKDLARYGLSPAPVPQRRRKLSRR